MIYIKDEIIDRFLRYVAIHTTSSCSAAEKGFFPSTAVQKVLSDLLVSEFDLLHISASVDANGYVYAVLPATLGCEAAPSVLFCSHLDTSDEVNGENVRPLLHYNYDGSVIQLPISGIDSLLTIDPSDDFELATCAGTGDTIITASGETLLGADDKAGIAEIMSALAYFNRHPELPHGRIEVMFSPDEETGHGMDRVPLDRISSKIAYTVDGGNAGEIEAECFNASRADIVFTGKAIHLGSARGKLRNAVTMAADFISFLPRDESPETTDGYYGYYCPLEVSGGIEESKLTIFLRDFECTGIERRTNVLHTIARTVEARYPGATVSVSVKKQYLNMKSALDKKPHVMELLRQAVINAGGIPVLKPIRGGTDGSRLTELGIPTPNIFTGGHNFHSRTEWASLNQMCLSCRTIIELITLYGACNGL